MTHSLSIIWNQSEGIDLGFFTVRYYSLMFVIAFGLGWYIMKKIFERENESIEKLDSIFIWTALATLVGARLGQVFFYDWPYFKEHPEEIFLPFKFNPFRFTGFSGLASHGAAIVIIICMYFFSKKVMKRPFLWVLDRVVIPVASGAIFVRIGNFFNSEIYGHKTSGDQFYAVKFVRESEFWKGRDVQVITNSANDHEGFNKITADPAFSKLLNEIPYRHPSQLYEAFGYIFVFLILFYAYWRTDARQRPGLLFGLFLIMLFTVRFIVEYVKESQGGFEGDNPILSTGQWLSIPFILVGLFFVFRSKKYPDGVL
ncbi:MAG: prolipoprotein diacylglyceryl transferase [Flavobacterium sp. BFFFF1]|uniref:prolipoprotein diacylglyceryl transferase n=1 Tax=Flavobacterium sp. BFFFF1 TaxID=2015557 RepID=UPI000BD7C3E4|nr:prolipoprotein diacylglyceryl transferase [Flavobacterium sp. BFFFF1]OYU80143.1 MAG: prolipoprotein diacylglyceryl transferase [Flavobacterium sp. BFFFF1]